MCHDFPLFFFFVNSGDSLHISPLERSYKAKVLVHFPSNVDWNPFDEDAVRMVRWKLNLTSLTHHPYVVIIAERFLRVPEKKLNSGNKEVLFTTLQVQTSKHHYIDNFVDCWVSDGVIMLQKTVTSLIIDLVTCRPTMQWKELHACVVECQF